MSFNGDPALAKFSIAPCTNNAPLIPTEILSLVVQELQDDTAALKHCALSSFKMFILARQQLFSKILLRSGGACVKLAQLIAQKPELCSYARQVDVKITDSEDSVIDQEQAFSSIVESLTTYLHRFSFSSTNRRADSFVHLPTRLQRALLSLFRSPNVTTLDTSNLHDLPLTALAECAHLREISVREHTFSCHRMAGCAVILSAEEKREWHLKSLVIDCSLCSAFLLAKFRFSELRTLSAGIGTHFTAFCELLHMSQRSLEEVDGEMVLWGDSSGAEHRSSALYISNLRRCRLSVTPLDHYNMRNYLDFLAAFFVGGVGSDRGSLESLELSISLVHCGIREFGTEDGWSALDSALTHPAYPMLRLVKITIKMPRVPVEQTGVAHDHLGPFRRLLTQLPLLSRSPVFQLWWLDVQNKPSLKHSYSSSTFLSPPL